MSEEGFFPSVPLASFNEIFPEKDSMVAKVVGAIQTRFDVRVAELYANDKERRKVSNILTVLKFLNLVVFSGRGKDKIVALNSHHRLARPIPLNQIMNEIQKSAPPQLPA